MANENDAILSTMKSVDKKLEGMNQEIVNTPAGDRAYHPYLVEKTPDPSVMEKVKYSALLTGKEPEVRTTIDQEDIDILKRKAYITLIRDFDRWVIKDFLGALDSETKKAWLRETYPSFFTRQVETMKKLNDVKAKYEILKIEGPETIEDLYFMFTYENLAAQDTFKHSILNSDFYGITSEPDAAKMASFATKQFERGMFNLYERMQRWNESAKYTNAKFKYVGEVPNYNRQLTLAEMKKNRQKIWLDRKYDADNFLTSADIKKNSAGNILSSSFTPKNVTGTYN
jgi:hypothetical protein